VTECNAFRLLVGVTFGGRPRRRLAGGGGSRVTSLAVSEGGVFCSSVDATFGGRPRRRLAGGTESRFATLATRDRDEGPGSGSRAEGFARSYRIGCASSRLISTEGMHSMRIFLQYPRPHYECYPASQPHAHASILSNIHQNINPLSHSYAHTQTHTHTHTHTHAPVDIHHAHAHFTINESHVDAL
jgi:hypothetical protein